MTPLRRSLLKRCCMAAFVTASFALPASSRVVLVGLDGASWNVIDPMIAAGELPNLAAIARDGVSADLETVEPVTSPVVWTSIATGRSPSNHGVTDFFSTSTDVRTPTVFERLAARGMRVGLYDYLMTWPPVDLPNGFVIPGWLRRDDAVTPSDVWTRAETSPWVNAYTPLKTNDDYRRNALEGLSQKVPRWRALFEHFDLDVGAISFYAPDAMSHRFWHGAHPDEFDPEVAELATPEERSALAEAMRGVDLAVGEIRSLLAPEDTIVIVSDHGFRAKRSPSDVWVSRFFPALARAGLDPEGDGFTVLTEFGQLVIRVHPGTGPDAFERADATTKRLADLIESFESADGDGLYWAAEVLDVAPRPLGTERGFWNRLRQWAVRTALDLVFGVELDPSSHAVVLAVPRAGALETLWPAASARAGGHALPVNELFSRQIFTGEHDPVAVFLAAGGSIRAIEVRARISVLDVAPLVFWLAGAPVPDDLEGSVPTDWIAATALAERPVRTLPAASMPGIDRRAGAAAAADDPDLTLKLRRLGYLE